MTKKHSTLFAILVPFAVMSLAAPFASYAMVSPAMKIPKPQGNFLPLPPRSNKHAVLPQNMRPRPQKVSAQSPQGATMKSQESKKTASYLSKEDAHKLLLYVYDEMR